MRIGIDVSPITLQRTGVGNYCYYLLKHLIALAPDCAFAGFSSGSVEVDLGPMKGKVAHRHIALPTRALYALWSALGRPKVDTFLGGVDVYHATNYFVPPTRTARRVMTVHDMGFLAVPELCSPKIRGIFAKRIRRFAHDADAVIACSASTKSDLVRYTQVDPEKVTVAYEAVDEGFGPVDRDKAEAHLASHYGIRPPFLLFVSTLEPRKNVPGLLRAFARVVKEIPHRLVLVGPVGWNAEPIFQTIAELGLADRVTQVGFVKSHAELPMFYSAADAFVFPSFYEGFGLALLEAMTCGCPVVTSNNSCIPEVVGDAALCVDATDVESLAAAIRAVIEKPDLRVSLTARGRDQARKFSWNRCAEITLDVYRGLAAK